MGNANSGRRPQPTALKVLRGNPSKTPLNVNEPRPEPATEAFDVPPAELTGDAVALAEWTRLAPMLRVCGMVSMAERPLLLALCQQWSVYLEAHAQARRIGLMVKADEKPVRNPYLVVASRALEHCIKLWVELGITPSGRSRMIAGPVAPTVARSKWEGLL